VTEFFVPFMLGFLGSGHCLGMCGPLVLAFSMQEGNPLAVLSVRNSIRHHLAFQSSRLRAALYGNIHGGEGRRPIAGLRHISTTIVYRI
jgi:sulfite exporter TauE/SafE